MRIALAGIIGGPLRSDPAIGSSGPGTSARCSALNIALGVLISAVPLAYSPFAPYFLKWAIVGLLTPLITFFWLWGGCGRPFRPLPKLIPPLLMLVLVSEVSLLQALNLHYGLQRIAFVLVLILLYCTVAYLSSQPDHRDRLVRYLLLTLLVVSGFSLYGFIMDPHAFPSPVQTLFRLFGNTNYGAAYFLTVIPLSLALFLKVPHRWAKAVWGMTLFLSMAVLSLSMVKGAWLSIWVGLGVVLWVLFRGERVPGRLRRNLWANPLVSTALLLGSAVMVAVALWTVYLSALPSFGEWGASFFDPETTSVQFRLAVWHGTLRMIQDHLWTGVGIGNFALAFVPYRSPFNYRNPGLQVEHPHNEYLNLGGELGLLGLLTLLWLVVRIVRLSWNLAGRAEANREVVAGVVGGLVATAAYAHLFYVVHVPASAMNLAILLGMLDGMDRGDRQEERGRPMRLTYLLPGLLVLGLLSFEYFLRPLVGEIHYHLGERELKTGRVEAGLRQLGRGLEWDPHSYLARYRRAEVFFARRRYAETIREAEEALKIHPQMEAAYVIRAGAYLHLGEEAKAKEILMEAIALNPHSPPALTNLGVLAARQGRITEAEALFLKAKRIVERREIAPYMNLGKTYEMTGRISEALVMYESAVAIKPQVASSWYNVARLRVLSGHPAGAYEPLARAIALDEVWRTRAAREPVFDALRRNDPRVRALLQLE